MEKLVLKLTREFEFPYFFWTLYIQIVTSNILIWYKDKYHS